MKKHSSVFLLAVRCTVYRLLTVLLVLLACDAAIFLSAARAGAALPDIYDMTFPLVGLHALRSVYQVCLMALAFWLTAALSQTQCAPLIRRLRVPEWELVAWFALADVLALFALWFWQGAILTGFSLAVLGSEADPMLMVLAAFRDRFVHSILPFEDLLMLFRQVSFCVSLGVCAACSSARMRLGKSFQPLVGQAVWIALCMGLADVGSFWMVVQGVIALIILWACVRSLASGWKEEYSNAE